MRFPSRSLLIAGILSAAGLSAVSAAPAVLAITPVFSQLVSYATPEGFKVVFDEAKPDFYIQEAVRSGETVEKWSEMITLTGFKGFATKVKDPLTAAADNMLQGFNQACPKTLTAESLGTSTIDGREALSVFLGCGSIPTSDGQKRETAMVIFIKGKADVYTLQWAERAAAQDTPPALEPEIWKQRVNKLFPIRICDRVAGEKAPYPSCIGRK